MELGDVLLVIIQGEASGSVPSWSWSQRTCSRAAGDQTTILTLPHQQKAVSRAQGMVPPYE